jgi:fatty-acyl-CoA synthase
MFAEWLMAQPDLGPKWLPRFVRLSTSLPQTGTGKVTKVNLRREAWVTDEPVWWWPLDAPKLSYRLLTDDDVVQLAEGLAEHGRPPITPEN